MKLGMTIKYLLCRADLNIKVDYRVNGRLKRLCSSGMLFNLDNGLFSPIIYIYIYIYIYIFF